jgi:SHS2 domain-containing protein
MPFELRDHTADIAVAAEANTLDGVFAATANGLTAAMCDGVPDFDDASERFRVSVAAGSLDALLYDYLAELIYERDVRGVLPVDNEVTIPQSATEIDLDGSPDRWQLDASARGVPLSAVDARDVKAVTYSEMTIEETPEGWHAYVVFDV